MNQDESPISTTRIDIGGQSIILHYQGQVTLILRSNGQPQLEQTHGNQLLVEHQRRIQKLKEQKAKMGINTPPEILIEIEDLEKKIANWGKQS